MKSFWLAFASLSAAVFCSPVESFETKPDLGQSVETESSSSSNYSSLHESIQEQIIKHALDQESNPVHKKKLASIDKPFFNVSSKHIQTTTIDFDGINENDRYSELMCDRLKSKTAAVFDNFEPESAEKFKYYHCLKDIIDLKIVGACGAINETVLSQMSQLKSVSCNIVPDPYEIILTLPEWNNFPKRLPKQIESLKIEFESESSSYSYFRKVGDYVSRINWEEDLKHLSELKSFELEFGVASGFNEPLPDLWQKIFVIKQLRRLDLTIFIAGYPMGLMEDIRGAENYNPSLLGTINIIENGYIDGVFVDWVSQLNDLHFNEVNIDVTARTSADTLFLFRIKNLKGIKLNLILYELSTNGIFAAFSNLQNVPHIDTVTFTFQGFYRPGLLKQGIEMFNNHLPDNLLVQINFLPDTYWFPRTRQFKEQLLTDVEQMHRQGYSIKVLK